MTRTITWITHGAIIGYKYFDFGEDFSSKTMGFAIQAKGTDCKSKLKILLDDYENDEEIGVCHIGSDDGVYHTRITNVTGRHAIYFKVEQDVGEWFAKTFNGRHLFEMEHFPSLSKRYGLSLLSPTHI